MHRSSESVAAIATALSKAQTELTNPEKAMIGAAYDSRSDSSQSFRYASLSSGLDIVRKVLGGQQIAVAQTTEIDRPGGAINLTTVLMHSSGEWIASNWPVCALSEISQPRRMGAALTYARRYALFTMVGIAGEDDLDAAPVTDVPREGDRAANAGPAPDVGVAPKPARLSLPAVGAALEGPTDDSAATRAQLISEILTLPQEDLQTRAIAILKAKNRLSADDAKLVEDAFAARMRQSEAAQQIPMADEAASLPITAPLPLAASTVTVKPPRGRPRKIIASAEPIAPPVAAPKPNVDDNPPASTLLRADTTSGKIDNSALTISETRRLRDKAHLKFVASHPCLLCGRSPADAHHLRFTQPRGMSLKVSDEFTVPLCRIHHRDLHSHGDEVAWWERRAIEPIATARMLWISSRQIE